MQPVKRVEIVIDAGHLTRVLQLLSRSGANGYTVLSGVSGAGDRGQRSDDELSGALSNRYVLCACSVETLTAMQEDLRLLLKQTGGLCLVSDAESLSH